VNRHQSLLSGLLASGINRRRHREPVTVSDQRKAQLRSVGIADPTKFIFFCDLREHLLIRTTRRIEAAGQITIHVASCGNCFLDARGKPRRQAIVGDHGSRESNDQKGTCCRGAREARPSAEVETR